jgi:RNA polymerase sigma-70 factor (ECF subfamily)
VVVRAKAQRRRRCQIPAASWKEAVEERIAMAERERFLTLFLQSEAALRAFIGSLVLDRHAREDVLQECALTLWREFDRYEPQRPFGAWARGVAARKIFQRRQAGERFPVAFSPEMIQAVREAYDRMEESAAPRAEALSQCLERLPERSVSPRIATRCSTWD